MDLEILKYFGGLGVGGAIAGLMFFIYRKDTIQWQEAWRGQSEMVVQVVKENTAAITALISRLDERREIRR